jgi:TolB-like protein/Tfp pilus assembly protein PilF
VTLARVLFASGCVAAPAVCATAHAQCPDGTPPPCGRAVAAPAANSVAVLYFDNRSGDSTDAYLADGLTEEVITRLAGVARLTVRSRHLVRRYRGTDIADPAAVGRALNVRYLVTGSVRRAGGRLRVSAELVVAAGGAQVWGRQFDQAGDDVFAIQESVARDVATGIVGRLVPGEQRALVARPTRHPAAHDAYLRGNFFLAQRDSAGLTRAIREYEAALRLDPEYTDALARLAIAYGYTEWNAFQLALPRDSVVARARRAAADAVRRAPSSPDSWSALAMALFAANQKDLAPAMAAARRAVALDSTNAEAHHLLGSLLCDLLEFDSAAVHLHRSLAIEPARPITLNRLAMAAAWHGRWPEARRWLDSALSFDGDFVPSHGQVFLINAVQGDTAAARRLAARWADVPGLRSAGMWAASLLDIPAHDTAAVARFRRASLPPDGSELPAPLGVWVATVWLTLLNDAEGALTALERSRRTASLAAWVQGAALAPLHREPRLHRVIAESRP